jgi:U2 small nuclear ribonucleoprotein A'
MRLNADMISRSPAFFNAMKDRELDLRGNKIAVIENLAATQDQFDSLDLSDNEIRKLECLAVLPRTKLLIFNNNQINRIAENLGRAFPNLEHLVLTNNRFTTLKELEPLAMLSSLTMLSMVDNPVTKQQHYRAFLIAMLPKLRVLDFQKVKPAERQAAEVTYGAASAAKRQKTATEAAAKTFVPGAPDAPSAAPKSGPTPEQIARIKDAIANASSLEEVRPVAARTAAAPPRPCKSPAHCAFSVPPVTLPRPHPRPHPRFPPSLSPLAPAPHLLPPHPHPHPHPAPRPRPCPRPCPRLPRRLWPSLPYPPIATLVEARPPCPCAPPRLRTAGGQAGEGAQVWQLRCRGRGHNRGGRR